MRNGARRISEFGMGKELLSKVPEVTLYFWIIKVLCTTVGETAADFLNVNLGFGLTTTSIVMGILLLVVLFFQIKERRYVPGSYWLSVFLISIFGTLVTDNLTDSMGVPLELSTIIFSSLLAITFLVWYALEKTLSIQSIVTRRQELFYWLAILFTFALGTAAGDLMAESLGLGYLVTGIIVLAIIALAIIAWRLGLNSVLAFWIAYIMTRPLGASLGDYLSQVPANGGIGLGATITTGVFVLAILLTVIFLSISKKDVITRSNSPAAINTKPSAILWQVGVVIFLLVMLAGTGYYFRQTQLQDKIKAILVPNAPLGDVSKFRTISEDTLRLVRAGKLADAKSRIGDLEFAWDNAEAQLKPMSRQDWSKVDDAIDDVLRQLRSVHPDAAKCEASLESLISILDGLDNQEPTGTSRS